MGLIQTFPDGGGGGINIPNGSTVTPTDDITTWLKCAELTETYTTLNEVLADDDVMEKLFRSENASDYLVRSTTWVSGITANQTAMILIGANDYCANKLVNDSTWGVAISNSTYFENVLNAKIPTMTQSICALGEASASDSATNSYAWMAFAGAYPQGWVGQLNTSGNKWLKFTFNNPIVVSKIEINMDSVISVDGTGYNSNWRDLIFDFQASNDDSTFITLASNLHVVHGTSTYRLSPTTIVNNEKYKYYRLLITQNNVISLNTPILSKVQFYGRTSQPTIIYSAANDIVSFIDDEGAKVVTTDATGKGEVTIVCKPNTDITFTSSVAKDPDNLSENYSKVVTVKSSAEPVYVMPNSNTLYWYGYKSSDFAECTDANGWTFQTGQSYTSGTPSYSTNYATLDAGERKYIGFSCSTPMSNISIVHALVQVITSVSGFAGFVAGCTNKIIIDTTSKSEVFASTSITKVDTDVSTLTGAIYPFVCSQWGRQSKVYALWYSDTDDDSKAEISAIGTNEPNVTSSRDYAVGEHFYKNGKFCTCTQPIAQGATFTLGTNYVEGTIADSILDVYSASEICIGSWFGSPLYRKCFDIDTTLSANGTYTLASGITPNNIVNIHGVGFIANTGLNDTCTMLPFISRSNINAQLGVQVDYVGNIFIYNGSSGSTFHKFRIVIEYTK